MSGYKHHKFVHNLDRLLGSKAAQIRGAILWLTTSAFFWCMFHWRDLTQILQGCNLNIVNPEWNQTNNKLKN